MSIDPISADASHQRVEISRLATGVPGLDHVLGGGLPELSFNLIAGPPGSGKTILAHQLMFAVASDDKPAVYFTVLGEPPLKMLRYQQQFDFFDAAALNRCIHYVNLGEEALSGHLEMVLARILAEVEARRPALVFVDSFRSVILANQQPNDPQNQVQAFVQQLSVMMTSWKATTFLVGEFSSDAEENPVLAIADGVIWMSQSTQRNSVVRKMQIMKMRGQATVPGLHKMRIGASGVEVIPPAWVTAAAMGQPVKTIQSTVTDRVSIGVPMLDKMLGGGLPLGCSLLVAGPSGAGKSVLAAAFLAAGVEDGKVGVLAAFEQRADWSRHPLLRRLIANGQVALVDSVGTDLSIDEIVLLLLDAVRRHGANRVVIDSVSGFELALAPTFRDDFRESLAGLVFALNSAGVTVLLTCELEDRYGDLRFSPYGTAFMTDAIIVQRYIELESRLRRLIAVVKVRGSRHDDSLRLFTIDEQGIQIGDALPGHEGLLGGRATLRLGNTAMAGKSEALPPAA